MTSSPATPATTTAPLQPLTDQAEALLGRGVVPQDVLSPAALRSAAVRLQATAAPGALLVVHPRLLPPSALAAHLVRTTTVRSQEVERAGFVVLDMTDVDSFAPVPGLEVPDADVYAVAGLDRGDDLANWSPEEAAPELEGRGRSPLTLTEGVHWVLQAPEILERNLCFMTIGSRLRTPKGSYDARTPAIWISNGTGRDGSERRGAAKVGWCWWRNRHTWLGFASATGRTAA